MHGNGWVNPRRVGSVTRVGGFIWNSVGCNKKEWHIRTIQKIRWVGGYQGHLTMYGDISEYHDGGWVLLLCSVEARDAAKYLAMCRTSPYNIELSCPKVSNAKVEKLCSTQISHWMCPPPLPRKREWHRWGNSLAKSHLLTAVPTAGMSHLFLTRNTVVHQHICHGCGGDQEVCFWPLAGISSVLIVPFYFV